MRITRIVRGAGLLALAGGAALVLGGCSYSRSKTPGVAYGLESVLDRSQFVIGEDVEGEGTVTRILGFIDLGDRQYGWASGFGVDGTTAQPWQIKDAVGAATYNILMKTPDADFILPVNSESHISGIPFIYTTETAQVKAKAVRIKNDSELAPKAR